MIPKIFGLSRCRSPEDKGLLCKSQTPVANNQGQLVRAGWEKRTRCAWRRSPMEAGESFWGQKSLFWLLEISTRQHRASSNEVENWAWTINQSSIWSGVEAHQSLLKPSGPLPERSRRTNCTWWLICIAWEKLPLRTGKAYL